MKKLIAKIPQKQKLAAIVALSFAVAYTFFSSLPVDLYYSSPADFVVGLKFLLPILIVLSFIMFMAILLVLLFLLKILKGKAIDIILLAVFGVLLAGYIQVLLLNGNMVRITGDAAPSYNAINFYNVTNLIVWLVIALIPVAVWAFRQKKGKNIKYELAIVFGTFLICAMQTAGILSVAFTTSLPPCLEDEKQYLSYEPVVKLSKDKNIVVFIMDRLDGNYMNETLEEYPDLQDKLDGFTFYQNNISEFEGTFPSITTMLTQQYDYEGLDVHRFQEYWDQLWSKDNVISTLKENGFTTNLLLSLGTVYGNISDLGKFADNLVNETPTIKHDFNGTANTIGNLSLVRLAPYFVKNIFLSNISSAFGNDFYTFSGDFEQIGVKNTRISAKSDMEFHNFVTKNSVNADSEKPVFNVIHLISAHVDFNKSIRTAGYHYDAETQEIVLEGNYVESTYGSFMILDNYVTKMKENGVFDNTTIIVLGDHGRDAVNVGISANEKNPAVTTSLLIKPANEHGAFKINTKDELSNKYFAASVLEYAGIPHSELGVSYNDLIKSGNYPTRRYYDLNPWWEARVNPNFIKMMGYYDISGDARDFNNWKYTEIAPKSYE